MIQQLPSDKNIEKEVIACLIMEPNFIYQAMEKLFEDIFYQDDHKQVFIAAKSLYDRNQTVDLLSISQKLKEMDSYIKIPELAMMTNRMTSSASMDTHIMILSEMYLKRQAIKISQETESSAYKPETDAFNIMQETGLKIDNSLERILTGKTKDLTYFGMKVLEQHSEVKKTGVIGLKTGLQEIDANICGLVPPDLIIIAARPGQGKTALALTITYNTSILSDVPCAWFSLEMDGVQLVRRLAAMDSGISHDKIRTGKTTEEEERKLHNSIAKITEKGKIYIEDRTSINIRDIKTRANILKRKHGIKYIVVDYLQLMESVDPKNKVREQVISEISRNLKLIAKELEMPVIALSQLSRNVEQRPDKMPQMSDLRESGAIEQDADSIILLMRPETYDMMEPVEIGKHTYDVKDLTIVKFAKNRHSEPRNTVMTFRGNMMKFVNYTNYDEDIF